MGFTVRAVAVKFHLTKLSFEKPGNYKFLAKESGLLLNTYIFSKIYNQNRRHRIAGAYVAKRLGGLADNNVFKSVPQRKRFTQITPGAKLLAYAGGGFRLQR